MHLNSTNASYLSKHVMNMCNEGVVITEPDATIIDVNPAMCNITGFKREQIIGKTPRIFRSGLHDENFYKQMWLCLKKNGSWQGEIWDRNRSGEPSPRYLRIKAIYNELGELVNYVGLMQDISRLQTLSQLANKDPLTGLPNRRLFDERLSQSIARAKRTGKSFALLYLDLDEFKLINDTKGHLTGDKVLRYVANMLINIVREEDMVARLGGDEFAVILPEVTSSDDVDQVCKKIRQDLKETTFIDGDEYGLGCSVGYSIFPNDAESISQLVHHADKAMFRYKRSRKNKDTHSELSCSA